MAVATADRQAQRKDGDFVQYKMIASDTIYKGTMVCIDVGHATNDGYAEPAKNTQFAKFIGVAAEQVTNGTTIGAKTVDVYKGGTFEFVFSGTATQADVGKEVYIVDDQTVGFDAIGTAYMVKAGTIVEFISATNVRVRIDDAVDLFPEVHTGPVAVTESIARGDMVCNADVDYLASAADTANFRFVGVAIKAADNSTGAAGAINVSYITRGICYFTTTQAIATYEIGDPMYADGAQALDTAGGTANVDMLVGRLKRKAASGNACYVDILPQGTN